MEVSEEYSEGLFADETDEALVDYDMSDNDGDSLSDDGGHYFSESDVTEQSPVNPQPQTTWGQQVNIIHLRRYINQLAENVQERSYEVEKQREELKKCRNQKEKLEKEQGTVAQEIDEAEQDDNNAALFRLKATLSRLDEEIENENILQATITEALDKAEYELAQAQVEQGKLLLAEDELKQKEEKLLQEKTDQADIRSRKEQDYADQALREKRNQQRSHHEMVHQQTQLKNHQVEEAIRSHQKADKYLQKTIAKVRQREVEEQHRQKEHMQQRMESMLKLKRDIATNRENLQALQARDSAMAERKKALEEERCRAIEDAGGNPSAQLIRQRKMEEYEKEKELFALKQRERQIDIAERIVQEEDRMMQRKHQQPYLYPDPQKNKEKIVKPHRHRKVELLNETGQHQQNSFDFDVDKSRFEGETGDESDEDDVNPFSMDMHGDQGLPNLSGDEGDTGTTLAQPEFEGMWDKHKDYKAPKEQGAEMQLPGGTKMDRDIMKRVLEKHKEGIIIKQVAGGKEFQGQAFYSKPDVIHFKDFDVGKTYKKKVTLTNVSYSVNYCKLVGLTEHLKDFITLQFDPPGQMSAGLTCELNVTFKPMINEDLSGCVDFLAQTGPFKIPLICTTKKCDLHVDKTTLDFGTSVIGETLKRTFTLSNNGALATKFEFFKVTDLKMRTATSVGTSLGRLETANSNMQGVSPDDEEVQGAPSQKTKESVDGISKEVAGDAGKTVDDESEKSEDLLEKSLSGESEGEEENDFDDIYSLDGMKTGLVSSGEVGPFCSVKLEVVWQPTIPGKVDTELCITFDDPDSEKISISAIANAIPVPVWVERQSVDLKICMFNRLYQDTIIVNNRATTALRLKFEVCPQLKNHLELLPKTGYIQAQSQFSAQMKFLPRKSLFKEAGEFFDADTGVLEAPMLIRVANQTQPVPFTVHAVVTNSDLDFDVVDVDFGHCTIHESTVKRVQLTNKSILPQQFGFLGIPDFVDVQPNDGFGTLLPLETIDLEIIFQPSKAQNYNFELTCKSLINRDFKISCQGVGVHPPLELSHQVVHFAATAVNDISTASIHVANSHTSTNEFTHPVPRIGKGEIVPVGPTSFQFVIPENAPISISPAIGTVEPGKKCHVHIRYSPTLNDSLVRKEGVRLLTKAMEVRVLQEYNAQVERERELQEQQSQKGGGKKGGGGTGKGKASPAKGKNKLGQDSLVSITAKGPPPVQPPDEDKIIRGSSDYCAAYSSLLRQFSGDFNSFTIPCYVASGKCGNPGELPYSVSNTLYLEVHCPAVRPQLVVISDNGRSDTNFGDISIGQSVIKSITIQNIADKTLDLRASCLDPEGPFSMLNALRVLPPSSSHTVLLRFTPHKGEVFQEVQEIFCPNSTLHLTLKGRGVNPMVNVSIKGGMMDMGTIIATEYREETFKIVNTSTLSVHYSIKLDSTSLLRHNKAQGLPHFVKRDSKPSTLVGTQNYNGQHVFDCVPVEGSIVAGGTKEITVTFAPDHSSDHYSDGIRIELFGQEEQHVFQMKGQAKSHIMYLEGGDDLLPEVESLALIPPEDTDIEESKPEAHPLLVTLYSVAKEKEITTATRDIFVGCVRTMAVSQKKNGEWIFDGQQQINNQGFSIEPAKGMIEASTRKAVTVSWTPPPGYDTNKPMEASIMCTLKGDITEQVRVLLRGIVTME